LEVLLIIGLYTVTKILWKLRRCKMKTMKVMKKSRIITYEHQCVNALFAPSIDSGAKGIWESSLLLLKGINYMGYQSSWYTEVSETLCVQQLVSAHCTLELSLQSASSAFSRKFRSWQISFGIVPDNSVLWNLSPSNLDSFPSSDGMVPVSLLFVWRFNWRRLEQFPISEGIVPSTLLLNPSATINTYN
jgi:hypothetical protein